MIKKSNHNFPLELGTIHQQLEKLSLASEGKRGIMEKVVQQKHILQEILEGINIPLYVINVSNYEIELANSAAIQKKGALEPGTTCYAFTHKSDVPCWQNNEACPLKAVCETKKPAVVVHHHHAGAEDLGYFEIHAHPLFNEKGEVEKIVEYSIDVTHIKSMENELKRKIDEVDFFREVAVEREIKMIDLKKEINALSKLLNRPDPYDIPQED